MKGSMNNPLLQELLEQEISDLYSAEVQITSALKKSLSKVSDELLKNILAHHLKETDIQRDRLTQLAAECELSLKKSHVCKGMQGILVEAEEAQAKFKNEAQRDIAFALVARRVENYEAAGYMSAILLARALGEHAAISLLDQTLQEEKEADNKLVTLLEETLIKKLETFSTD